MRIRSFVYARTFPTICALATIVFVFANLGHAQTFTNIDSMQGWETCTTCAGAGGTGPATPHSVQYNVSSPSIDGAAVHFTNGGTAPFSDAIWWRQLGGNANASNFVYDLYFYFNDPAAAQALEFDVNQSAGGRKYIWGTQCGVAWNRQWSVWGNNRWNPTGIGCNANPNSWNHLTLEFSRANGGVNFVAVTLNGQKSYINRSYAPIGSGVNEINVAFQMDQSVIHRTFSAWLDRVSLNCW
jgi:hypothetical protein